MSSRFDEEPERSPGGERPGGVLGLLAWRTAGIVRTVRPHQWVKNVFVLAPVVFAREMFMHERLVRSVGAFGVFCLLAGAVYTMNDIADRAADSVHPVKKHRPIASGQLPLRWARWLAGILVVVSLAGALVGPWEFAATALAYFLLNVGYSFGLKRFAYVDVAIIALGFVLRVLAGGFATHTEVSTYLLTCTALLALFLGLGKRLHELTGATKEASSQQRSALVGYSSRGVARALNWTGLATVSCYVAYTFDPGTIAFFGSDNLWWTAGFVALGVWRFLYLVRDRPKAESPTQEMLRDGPFVAILCGWVGVVLWIVYNLEPTT